MSQRASSRVIVASVLHLRALPDGSVRCIERERAFHEMTLPCGILVCEIFLGRKPFLLETFGALRVPRVWCGLHISVGHPHFFFLKKEIYSQSSRELSPPAGGHLSETANRNK